MKLRKCYDEFWLPYDMQKMGYIFEECEAYVKEICGVDIDKVKFLTAFMKSGIRRVMESGHACLISQSSYDTIEQYIEVDCNGDVSQWRGIPLELDYNHWYWVGHTYSYVHFRSKMLSADLVDRLPIETLLNGYIWGHQMGEEAHYQRVLEMFKEKGYVKSRGKSSK